MHRVLFNFILAMEGVFANQIRALLTALGIIFGVAAVIAMLAIGTGAKQSILEQMKLIGTHSLVIKTVLPEDGKTLGKRNNSNTNSNGENKRPWSPGLRMNDVQAIQTILPVVERISPEIVLPVSIIQSGKMARAKCVGVTNAFFELNNLKVAQGNYFHQLHLLGGKPVCVIGKHIQTLFFPEEDPIGKKIKCRDTWLTIIGVLQKRNASQKSLKQLGIRDYNSDVYVPIKTALLRFEDRAKITKDDINQEGENEPKSQNYNQLDKVVVRVTDSKYLRASADVVGRMLKRRHRNILDYEIEIPELLLQQQQKTQDTFNFVLAVIAGISLLVGGIGIMNIMLASVLERIKEIGLRRSLGANQKDIVLQFLFEAVFISLTGGMIGIFVGLIAAKTISASADIPTVVSLWSVLLSFGVAASIGLIFGIVPAQRAAKLDPIKALRAE